MVRKITLSTIALAALFLSAQTAPVPIPQTRACTGADDPESGTCSSSGSRFTTPIVAHDQEAAAANEGLEVAVTKRSPHDNGELTDNLKAGPRKIRNSRPRRKLRRRQANQQPITTDSDLTDGNTTDDSGNERGRGGQAPPPPPPGQGQAPPPPPGQGQQPPAEGGSQQPIPPESQLPIPPESQQPVPPESQQPVPPESQQPVPPESQEPVTEIPESGI